MKNKNTILKFKEFTELSGSDEKIAYISEYGDNSLKLKIYHGYGNLVQYFLLIYFKNVIRHTEAPQKTDHSALNPWYYYYEITIDNVNKLQTEIYKNISNYNKNNNKNSSDSEGKSENKQTVNYNKLIERFADFGLFICECVKLINEHKEKNANHNQNAQENLDLINITQHFNDYVAKHTF
jgi:hypothetical protein